MLYTAKIDSFKLRVPERLVQIVDPTFLQRYQKVYVSSGLIDDNIKLDNHKVNLTDGISTRIGIAYFRSGKDIDREEEASYYFQLNSKMLKSRYLNGINVNNIRLIYNYIINLNIVYLDYDDFLDGYITDIDVAYDIECEPKTLKSLIPKILSKVLLEKQKFIDKPHLKDDNIGVSFNKREKAINKAPFIKIYHKTIELEHNSNEFANAHLKATNYQNIARLEFTFKDSKHRKYLKVKCNTLRELLSLDDKILTEIVSTSIATYYIEKEQIKPTKTIISNSKIMTWYERVISILIQDRIEKGADDIDIYKVLNFFPGETESDKRVKRKVRKYLENIIGNLSQKETIEKLDKNKKERAALRALKLDNVI
jgi:hypothetical protein